MIEYTDFSIIAVKYKLCDHTTKRVIAPTYLQAECGFHHIHCNRGDSHGTKGEAIAMIAVIDKTPVSIDQFLDWYPQISENRYELRRGVIVEMPKPRGKHSEIAGFAIKTLNTVIDKMQVPFFIPRECIVKISDDTGYEPDVAVLNRPNLANESRWESSSVIEHGESVKLVVEVVSTNWRDDYALKMTDYESIGIGEYWILDYLGIGGRRYIGSPKQPTFTVCTMVDGEYELQQFRGNDRIISPTFPEFQLTVNQIFHPGE